MKRIILDKTLLRCISNKQRVFLKSLIQKIKTDAHGIPIYTQTPSGFNFISDFKMPEEANEKFEKEAPKELFRGGAIIKIISRYGILIVPDNRYNWLRLPGGLAHFNEGCDLVLTGGRELIEEVFICDLKKTTRYVPIDYADVAAKDCSLNFAVKNIKEIGEINLISYEVNYTNKCLEAVLEWNISTIKKFFVNIEEEWQNGSKSGISVLAMNTRGSILGIFSGQQGFIKLSKFGIHETLKKLLK